MRMRSKHLWASVLLATAIGCGGKGSDVDDNNPQNVPPTVMQPGGSMTPGAPTTPGPTTSGPTTPSNPGTGPTTPTTPTAGSGSMMGAAGSDAPTMMNPGPTMMGDDAVDGRGKCGIDSGFPGDETCLLPPDPSEGFQIHVGPKDYNDPAEINKFLFAPNKESSECWGFHTPNTEDAYWQTFELSGRAGTHHIINTMFSTDRGDSTAFLASCGDPGTGMNPNIIGNLPGASKAYMPRGKVAPENEHLGRKVPAKAYAEADMHYFNFTDKPLLREFWMNIYTVPKDKITSESNQIRGMGGLSWIGFPIPMQSTPQVFTYECPIDTDGRIIALLGHYHSHGKRFTAWVSRGGQDTKVFEMFDYLDPKIFNYDTITTNPQFADASAMQAGATSGILEVKSGDVLKWECEILNDDQPGGLRYTNEVKTGEMCNLWGESVGPLINCTVL